MTISDDENCDSFLYSLKTYLQLPSGQMVAVFMMEIGFQCIKQSVAYINPRFFLPEKSKNLLNCQLRTTCLTAL